MKDLILKSCAASFCLSLAIPVLLNEPVYGSLLFSIGLYTICVLKLKLFTGIVGFIFEDRICLVELFTILFFNVICGYLFGFLFSIMDNSLVELALRKVDTWEFSFSYFLKTFMCGAIMYIAVKLYREKTSLGIFFGVPLFLFSGFQHSIANSIIMGTSNSFSFSLILAILGNLIGALFIWFLSKNVISFKIKL